MKKYIALLLALVLCLSVAGCASKPADPTDKPTETQAPDVKDPTDAKPEEPTVKVMTHAEFDAVEDGKEVTVETYVQAKQGWWEKDGQGVVTVYTQTKDDGAYFLYEVPCTKEEAEKLVPGTKIRVTGTKASFNGEIEIADVKYEILDGDKFIAEPLDVTKLMGTDDLIKHQNERIALKNVTVEASSYKDENGKEIESAYLYKWDGSGKEGDDLYFKVSIDGKTYTVLVESYLCGADTDVYKAVKNLKVGDKIDLEGFQYWYEGPQAHITSVVPAK